jgi:DNA-binding NtrC family response regulator
MDQEAMKKTVIIVNDDTDLLNLFKDALDNQKIDTIIFTSPTLALEKIKAYPNQFSLVLINYATQVKRSRKKFANDVKAINGRIKVLLTSGYKLNAEDISRDGYDRFLQLPVKISDLVFTVKEMLAD